MMTTPIFFPRLLVLALAGAVFCLPHAASAQHAPEVSFHPAKSWFNSQNDVNGTPYCTLENEFNNGFILKFDGAGKGPMALAIDFRQDVFEPGKSYAVTLNVPGLSGKILNAAAAEKNVLRIPVQGQKALYESIRNASVLDLTIEKNNFRFYMVGFADAAKDFEACAGAMDDGTKVAAKAPETPDAATPPIKEILPDEAALTPVKEAAPAPATQVQKSPPAKITRNVRSMEADLTGIGDSGGKQSDLLHKISDLEKMVQKLEEENDGLNEEIKTTLQEGVQEKASISSENWNLERATMRFQEAERQLKAMGQRLQRDQAQCDMEKKNLENMLFDPQVTTQEQLAKLADLERQLESTRAEMENQRKRYEERIRILESQAGIAGQ